MTANRDSGSPSKDLASSGDHDPSGCRGSCGDHEIVGASGATGTADGSEQESVLGGDLKVVRDHRDGRQ